jgi:hypothetical protein
VHRAEPRHRSPRHGHGDILVVYPEGYEGEYAAEPAPGNEATASAPLTIQGGSIRPMLPVPAPSPKVTELPAGKNAPAGKAAPAAIFVLKSGQRIEAQHYLLSAHQVQLTSDRQRRVIPLSELNIQETVAANRQRGLDLQIPSDSGIVSVGF